MLLARFASAFLLLLSAMPAADFDAATATNHVGLDLYRQLAAGQPTGNLVISPYSIESALALAYVGADADTRTEMARVLHFPADDPPLQRGFADLRTALDRIASQSRQRADSERKIGGSVDVIEWNAANRLFGQRGNEFRGAFLARMKDEFAAPLEALDFRAAPEPSRQTINAWVEEQTRRKIRNLIPPGAVSSDTRLVLVNALYLKAPWAEPFNKRATQPQPFHLPGGGTRDVATMRQTKSYGYVVEDGLTIVALDYTGGGLRFVILLPPKGQTVDAVAAKLTPKHFSRWARIRSSAGTLVNLHLPRFRVEGSTVPLGTTLNALGVKLAFDKPRGSADFSRIAPRTAQDYLALSEVFHQTFIALDEAGTEAAAATAVAMMVGSAERPATPVEVRVDRPFLFAIQHAASGTCLFLGRIDDPRW